MFAVVVTFTIVPGEMATFLPAVLANARASLGEPACNRFDVLTDPDRPDEVFLYELYDDEDGFKAHQATKHYEAFGATIDGLVADKQVRTYRNVQG